jgi:hypothetical protein
MASQSSDPSVSASVHPDALNPNALTNSTLRPDALPDRLVEHLRTVHETGSAGLHHLLDEEHGLFDAEPSQPSSAAIVAAERSAPHFASGPAAQQSAATFPLPDQPVAPQRPRSAASLIKNLAKHGEDAGNSTRLRKAISTPEATPATTGAVVDPSQLPPPMRKGFTVATPARVHDAHHGPTVFVEPSKRDVKRQAAAARKVAKQAAQQQAGMAPAEILDQRVPGKYQEDSAFLVPLIPALLVAAGGTYLWFQGAIRLMSLLPLTPIILGVIIGGIMRMGSRSVDFARIIFAVMITGFATFWGYAAILEYGPLNELTKTNALWSDLPRVADPTVMIPVFRDLAEKSLGTAAIMFGGFLAAGMVSSVRAK